MPNEKLQKYYGYTGLAVKRAYHQKYEQTQPPNVFALEEKNTLVGIEIEVENITNPPYLTYYWKSTTDGSLRNNGIEYVSIPLRTSQVEHAVTYLNQQLLATNEPEFSPRTSVHVHLNVRDFTWEQVKVFVLLYALFERHFFHFAGRSRENSVFCVPLYKTSQLSAIFDIESEPKWHKYNALNLAPIYGDMGENLKRYGTIEFRHLFGTLDTATIIQWINNICCLRKYSATQKLDDLLIQIKNLNTTSEYISLYKNIFGQYADLNKMTKHDFESCVSFTKIALWGKDLNVKYKYNLNSRYRNILLTLKEEKKVVPKKGQLTGEEQAEFNAIMEKAKLMVEGQTWHKLNPFIGVTTKGVL